MSGCRGRSHTWRNGGPSGERGHRRGGPRGAVRAHGQRATASRGGARRRPTRSGPRPRSRSGSWPSCGGSSRTPPFDQASGGDAPPPRLRIEELGDELRRLYARLDEYRRQPVLTPDDERRHGHDLAEYDRTLVAVCDRMGIPTGLRPGEPVGAEVRATLTRTLARAGLDVRTAAASGPTAPRVQRRRRFSSSPRR